MTTTATTQKENLLYRKVDNTMYEISVKQSDNAKESAEDILVRLITADSSIDKEETNG